MGVSYTFVTCCARRGSIHRQYGRHKDVHSCCIKAMSKHQATFVRSGTDNGGLLLMAIMALKNTAYDLKYHLYVKTRGNHFVAMFYARIKTNNRVSYDKYHPNPHTYIQNSQAMSRAIKCFCKVYKILKLLTQQCHSNRVTRAQTSSQITKILPVAAAKGEFSHVLRVKIFYGNGKRYINKDHRSLKRFRTKCSKTLPLLCVIVQEAKRAR